MRIVVITGKGGVGKTTIAAATAHRAASCGHRTLVVSTDSAHSLGEVLDAKLGASPSVVAERLDAAHVDGRHELSTTWREIARYMHEALGWSDLDRLHVEELALLPGFDQLLALARIRQLADEDRWDAMVIDCAPSADSLRLLSLPETVGWYLDRLVGRAGVLGRWVRRRVEQSLPIPTPTDAFIQSLYQLNDQLMALRDLLNPRDTSARIVVTPERVVINEARRLLAYLALYGYAVDAVVVNKLLDDDVAAACGWLDAQCRYRAAIDEAFSPIPRLGAPLCNEEPAGADRLAELGHVIYDTSDPMDRFAPGAAIEILTHGAESLVRVPVGGVDRADIDLALDGDELLVTLGAHRRAVRLPDALSGHEVTGASVVDGHLEVVFQGSAP